MTAELDIQVKSDGKCAEHEERQEMIVNGHLLAPSCIGLNGLPSLEAELFPPCASELKTSGPLPQAALREPRAYPISNEDLPILSEHSRFWRTKSPAGVYFLNFQHLTTRGVVTILPGRRHAPSPSCATTLRSLSPATLSRRVCPKRRPFVVIARDRFDDVRPRHPRT